MWNSIISVPVIAFLSTFRMLHALSSSKHFLPLNCTPVYEYYCLKVDFICLAMSFPNTYPVDCGEIS